jgi:hypothetical protein
MTNTFNKFIWKIQIQSKETATAENFFKVFNTWIPDSLEVFVDVTDYAHVHNGPITLLVGHYVDYVLDNSGGELGLMYRQKREFPLTAKAPIEQGLAQLQAACKRLENDSTFAGKLKFDTSKLTLILNDRALASNSKDGFKQVLPQLSFLDEKQFSKEMIQNDPRDRLTIQINRS